MAQQLILPTEKQEQRITKAIESRFYNVLTFYNVALWLNNFEQDDFDDAITVLEHVEYYRFDDCIDMIKQRLISIFSKIPNLNKRSILITPVGDPGKSGDMLEYLTRRVLKDSKNEQLFNGLNVLFNRVEYISGPLGDSFDVIIYVDDFIGTGDTFTDFYTEKDLHERTVNVDQYLMCYFILDTGKKRLNKKMPSIKVVGEQKVQVFQSKQSPFGCYAKKLPIRKMCYRYGRKLFSYPLGYENSQSLVCFENTTPNNTLPIIWCEKNWVPLFPRFFKYRGARAAESRLDIKRWLPYFKDVLIDVENDAPCVLYSPVNATLLYLLTLKEANQNDYVIINKMGITMNDLDKLYQEGIEKNMWNNEHQITESCHDLFLEFKKKRKFAGANDSPDSISDNIIYVPEIFNGKS